MDMEHGPELEQNQEDSFLQEVIKKEKLDWKKILKKGVRLLCLGLVLGMAMSVGFCLVQPWVENLFSGVNRVEISDTGLQDSGKEETHIVINNDLDMKQCVVWVSGIKQGENWQGAADSSVAGCIVADNGKSLLVLTNYSRVKEDQLFRVKFADGTSRDAVLEQKDVNTNLAILSVAKKDLSESTIAEIKVTQFGNMKKLSQGAAVIVCGSPMGYEDGVAYGVVSSLTQELIKADGQYTLLITDIQGVDNSSGVIFDAYRRAVGLVDTQLTEDGNHVLAAIGISDVKDIIELMCNGESVPYMGLVGTMITEELSKTQNIPEGFYVTQVEVDSPAMAAGIQNGDVITEYAGEPMKSLDEFHQWLLNQKQGDVVRINGQRSGQERYVEIKFDVTVGVK